MSNNKWLLFLKEVDVSGLDQREKKSLYDEWLEYKGFNKDKKSIKLDPITRDTKKIKPKGPNNNPPEQKLKINPKEKKYNISEQKNKDGSKITISHVGPFRPGKEKSEKNINKHKVYLDVEKRQQEIREDIVTKKLEEEEEQAKKDKEKKEKQDKEYGVLLKNINDVVNLLTGVTVKKKNLNEKEKTDILKTLEDSIKFLNNISPKDVEQQKRIKRVIDDVNNVITDLKLDYKNKIVVEGDMVENKEEEIMDKEKIELINIQKFIEGIVNDELTFTELEVKKDKINKFEKMTFESDFAKTMKQGIIDVLMKEGLNEEEIREELIDNIYDDIVSRLDEIDETNKSKIIVIDQPEEENQDTEEDFSDFDFEDHSDFEDKATKKPGEKDIESLIISIDDTNKNIKNLKIIIDNLGLIRESYNIFYENEKLKNIIDLENIEKYFNEKVLKPSEIYKETMINYIDSDELKNKMDETLKNIEELEKELPKILEDINSIGVEKMLPEEYHKKIKEIQNVTNEKLRKLINKYTNLLEMQNQKLREIENKLPIKDKELEFLIGPTSKEKEKSIFELQEKISESIGKNNKERITGFYDIYSKKIGKYVKDNDGIIKIGDIRNNDDVKKSINKGLEEITDGVQLISEQLENEISSTNDIEKVKSLIYTMGELKNIEIELENIKNKIDNGEDDDKIEIGKIGNKLESIKGAFDKTASKDLVEKNYVDGVLIFLIFIEKYFGKINVEKTLTKLKQMEKNGINLSGKMSDVKKTVTQNRMVIWLGNLFRVFSINIPILYNIFFESGITLNTDYFMLDNFLNFKFNKNIDDNNITNFFPTEDNPYNNYLHQMVLETISIIEGYDNLIKRYTKNIKELMEPLRTLFINLSAANTKILKLKTRKQLIQYYNSGATIAIIDAFGGKKIENEKENEVADRIEKSIVLFEDPTPFPIKPYKYNLINVITVGYKDNTITDDELKEKLIEFYVRPTKYLHPKEKQKTSEQTTGIPIPPPLQSVIGAPPPPPPPSSIKPNDKTILVSQYTANTIVNNAIKENIKKENEFLSKVQTDTRTLFDQQYGIDQVVAINILRDNFIEFAKKESNSPNPNATKLKFIIDFVLATSENMLGETNSIFKKNINPKYYDEFKKIFTQSLGSGFRSMFYFKEYEIVPHFKSDGNFIPVTNLEGMKIDEFDINLQGPKKIKFYLPAFKKSVENDIFKLDLSNKEYDVIDKILDKSKDRLSIYNTNIGLYDYLDNLDQNVFKFSIYMEDENYNFIIGELLTSEEIKQKLINPVAIYTLYYMSFLDIFVKDPIIPAGIGASIAEKVNSLNYYRPHAKIESKKDEPKKISNAPAQIDITAITDASIGNTFAVVVKGGFNYLVMKFINFLNKNFFDIFSLKDNVINYFSINTKIIDPIAKQKYLSLFNNIFEDTKNTISTNNDVGNTLLLNIFTLLIKKGNENYLKDYLKIDVDSKEWINLIKKYNTMKDKKNIISDLRDMKFDEKISENIYKLANIKDKISENSAKKIIDTINGKITDNPDLNQIKNSILFSIQSIKRKAKDIQSVKKDIITNLDLGHSETPKTKITNFYEFYKKIYSNIIDKETTFKGKKIFEELYDGIENYNNKALKGFMVDKDTYIEKTRGKKVTISEAKESIKLTDTEKNDILNPIVTYLNTIYNPIQPGVRNKNIEPVQSIFFGGKLKFIIDELTKHLNRDTKVKRRRSKPRN